jgi:hypothetical protein
MRLTDEQVQLADRLARAVMSGADGDDAFDDLDEDDVEHDVAAALAMTACLSALVRVQLQDVDDPDAELSRLAARTPLTDIEGAVIAVWIVEAALRSVAGQPQAVEGIPPDVVVESILSYLHDVVPTVTELDRHQALTLAIEALREIHRSGRDIPLPP